MRSTVNRLASLTPYRRSILTPLSGAVWEKATAIHVFCLEKRLKVERLTRHWYNIVQLDEGGFAERALSDHALAEDVAKHKSVYFAAKAAAGSQIDYSAAVNGGLALVPEGEALQVLETTTLTWSTTDCCQPARKISRQSWHAAQISGAALMASQPS
jgi:hypothetical protein